MSNGVAQLFSKVLANRVDIVQSSDIHTVVVPSNPPQDVFVNTDGPIGIVKLFSRIHLHEDLIPAINLLRGVHQADVVVLRASDQVLLGGVSLDFSNPPISLVQDPAQKTFTPIRAMQEFNWGDIAPSSVVVTNPHMVDPTKLKMVTTTPSYFLLQTGDALVTQLWLFSNTVSLFSLGWFSAVAYVKLNPDGTLQ